MFHEILLVVFLRRIEFRGGSNLRRNRPIELARLSPSRLHALGSLFLCFAGVENCGTILCTGVVVLPVQRRGIVHAEKIIQQRLVTEPGGIEHHLNRFRMASSSAADILIGWVSGCATARSEEHTSELQSLRHL